jgi:hypothetical protein
MSFFSNPLKYILTKILPRDTNDSAGYGPFRLPSPECDWMQKGAKQHDIDYTEGNVPRSVADTTLFISWVLEAWRLDKEDGIKLCNKFEQICFYWVIARKGGQYLWRHKK